MTNKLPREVAEHCVGQIKLMFPGYWERQGFGKPELREEGDRWLVDWHDGPYDFSGHRIPEGSTGVSPAPDWPEGVKVVAVERQTIALVPRETSPEEES
jgi:hypothetical protein